MKFIWSKKKNTKVVFGTDKLAVSSKDFPTLMQNESGSIFLVNKIKDKYVLVCLTADYIGDTYFGTILEANEKGIKQFKEMEEGFYIEIERHCK